MLTCGLTSFCPCSKWPQPRLMCPSPLIVAPSPVILPIFYFIPFSLPSQFIAFLADFAHFLHTCDLLSILPQPKGNETNCVVMMKLNDWKNILNQIFRMTVRIDRVISDIDTEVCIVAKVLLMLNFYQSDIFFCNSKQICKTIWRIPVR